MVLLSGESCSGDVVSDLALARLQGDGSVDIAVVSCRPGGLSLGEDKQRNHPLTVPQLSLPKGLVGAGETELCGGELLIGLLIVQQELMDLEIDLLASIGQLPLLDPRSAAAPFLLVIPV